MTYTENSTTFIVQTKKIGKQKIS